MGESSMQQKIIGVFLLTLIFLGVLLSGTDGPISHAASEAIDGVAPRKWELDLTGFSALCTGGHRDCHFSSPVLADMTNNGVPDVVVATNKGIVIAVRNNGTILWTRDVAPSFGMPAGTHEIASSPAVADIDLDGWPEVVIGVGTTKAGCSPVHHGGVIVLEHDGTVRPGWPRQSVDADGDGCRDSVNSTPALANLDADAELEIVAGGFDKKIYAWNPNGSLVPGFPPDSYHLQRFPTWPNLVGSLADTIWSSPAVYDVDMNGSAEIFIGTDEGFFDARYGGNAYGWSCPYALPPGWAPGYCGGSLYGLRADGSHLSGFPKYLLEAIMSSPSLADVTGDGIAEIFVGNGTFYYYNSPDSPTYGFQVFGYSLNGQPLPGWPVNVGGPISAAPAIGDITGDGAPEIVIPSLDSRVYAFRVNGQPVPGFPMTPRRETGQTGTQFSRSVVLGDYDGDGKMEIFLNNSWTVTVIDGNGQQLTGDNFPNNTKPIYYTFGSLLNSPAVGDIDQDGQLELIAQNSKLYVFDLPGSTAEADWPMFKRDARRSSTEPLPPRLVLPLSEMTFLHPISQPANPQRTMRLSNPSEFPFSWSADAQDPDITVSPTSGILNPGQSVDLLVTIDTGNLPEGLHLVGDIDFDALNGGQPIEGSPGSVSVVVLLGDISQQFIPMLSR